MYFTNSSIILSALPFKSGIISIKAVVIESITVDFFVFLFFSVSTIAEIMFSSAISSIVLFSAFSPAKSSFIEILKKSLKACKESTSGNPLPVPQKGP